MQVEKYVTVDLEDYGESTLHLDGHVREFEGTYLIDGSHTMHDYDEDGEVESILTHWYELAYDNPQCEGSPLSIRFTSEEY
ncbi:hypothetical protein LIS04_191 [Listeria phage LIS04]|nr:hypothetical protein LIS04_191 [Listeria phage LIS04]